MEGKGIIVVYTGNGKGKTTAALGAALRAAGYGMQTLMIQFIKEKGQSGEQAVCPSRCGDIDIYPFGAGFVFHGDDLQPHIEKADEAWRFMERQLDVKKYDILILDELNAALNLNLLAADRVAGFLAGKDKGLHVIITGRDAPKGIIDRADVVTEMREIKHLYKQGVPAIKGLDF